MHVVQENRPEQAVFHFQSPRCILTGMKILLSGAEIDLTPSLKKFVDMKLSPIARLLTRFEKEGELEIRVEVGKTTRHHRHGNHFKAEANLQVPKKLIRVVEYAPDARTAVDLLKKTMKIEIEKYKEKTVAQTSGRARR